MFTCLNEIPVGTSPEILLGHSTVEEPPEGHRIVGYGPEYIKGRVSHVLRQFDAYKYLIYADVTESISTQLKHGSNKPAPVKFYAGRR